MEKQQRKLRRLKAISLEISTKLKNLQTDQERKRRDINF